MKTVLALVLSTVAALAVQGPSTVTITLVRWPFT
jgi:hypothetical protein